MGVRYPVPWPSPLPTAGHYTVEGPPPRPPFDDMQAATGPQRRKRTVPRRPGFGVVRRSVFGRHTPGVPVGIRSETSEFPRWPAPRRPPLSPVPTLAVNFFASPRPYDSVRGESEAIECESPSLGTQVTLPAADLGGGGYRAPRPRLLPTPAMDARGIRRDTTYFPPKIPPDLSFFVHTVE